MCEKQDLFISLIQFQTIYTLLLQIRKCLELRVFGIICLPQKLRSRNSFDKLQVCLFLGGPQVNEKCALLKFLYCKRLPSH